MAKSMEFDFFGGHLLYPDSGEAVQIGSAVPLGLGTVMFSPGRPGEMKIRKFTCSGRPDWDRVVRSGKWFISGDRVGRRKEAEDFSGAKRVAFENRIRFDNIIETDGEPVIFGESEDDTRHQPVAHTNRGSYGFGPKTKEVVSDVAWEKDSGNQFYRGKRFATRTISGYQAVLIVHSGRSMNGSEISRVVSMKINRCDIPDWGLLDRAVKALNSGASLYQLRKELGWSTEVD